MSYCRKRCLYTVKTGNREPRKACNVLTVNAAKVLKTLTLQTHRHRQRQHWARKKCKAFFNSLVGRLPYAYLHKNRILASETGERRATYSVVLTGYLSFWSVLKPRGQLLIDGERRRKTFPRWNKQWETTEDVKRHTGRRNTEKKKITQRKTTTRTRRRTTDERRTATSKRLQ